MQPRLDFGALEPGRAATDAIRQAAVDQHLATDYGARVRLTGLIPPARSRKAHALCRNPAGSDYGRTISANARASQGTADLLDIRNHMVTITKWLH